MSASNTASDAKPDAVPRQLPRVRWHWSEDTGLVIVFLLMILGIGIPHPEFFSFGSIKTILRQSALVGIIAFGMVYLVAMVEIDLSVAVSSPLPAVSLPCSSSFTTSIRGSRSLWRLPRGSSLAVSTAC
jgi:ABC-type xylose transport system permease subunit